MKRIEYIVEGMNCQACSSAVSKKISSFESVKDYSVNLFSGEVEIEIEDNFDEKAFIVDDDPTLREYWSGNSPDAYGNWYCCLGKGWSAGSRSLRFG